MPQYIIEYVVTSFECVRVTAKNEEDARREVQKYHAQHEAVTVSEHVMITKLEVDE
jgi:hypothetical protein